MTSNYNSFSNTTLRDTTNISGTVFIDSTTKIVGLYKRYVGLGLVDNTSDIDKPISNAVKNAIQDISNNFLTKIENVLGSASILAEIPALNTLSELSQTVKDICGNILPNLIVNNSNLSVNALNLSNYALDASLSLVTTRLNSKADLSGCTFTGTVNGITKSMVGLGNVDNTADSAKPVSTAMQNALDLKASLESPTFTGIPNAPTANSTSSTNQIATTQFVKTAIDNLVSGAPGILDTLQEISLSLNNDPSFNSTMVGQLALKAPLESPTFTGTVNGITKSMVGLGNVDNTSDLSKPVSSAMQTALDLKASLESPTFTGTVIAPNFRGPGTTYFVVGSTQASTEIAGTTNNQNHIFYGTTSATNTINFGQTTGFLNIATGATKTSGAVNIATNNNNTSGFSVNINTGTPNASSTNINTGSSSTGTTNIGRSNAIQIVNGATTSITVNGATNFTASPTGPTNINDTSSNNLATRADVRSAISTLDNEVVKLTGNQSISGIKTFTSNVSMNNNLSVGGNTIITTGLRQPPLPMTSNNTTIPGHGTYVAYCSSLPSETYSTNNPTLNYFYLHDYDINTGVLTPYGYNTLSDTAGITFWSLSDTISDVSGISYPGYRFHLDLPYQILLTNFQYSTPIASRVPVQGSMLASNDGSNWNNLYNFDLSATVTPSTIIALNQNTYTHNITSNTRLFSKYALVVRAMCSNVSNSRFALRSLDLNANNTILSTSTIGASSISVSENLNVEGSIVNSALTSSLNSKAPLASPALTGTPTAPTAAVATNTTQIATTAFVMRQLIDISNNKFTIVNATISQIIPTVGAMVFSIVDQKLYVCAEDASGVVSWFNVGVSKV